MIVLFVLITIYYIINNKPIIAGICYGIVVHFRIYPIIYIFAFIFYLTHYYIIMYVFNLSLQQQSGRRRRGRSSVQYRRRVDQSRPGAARLYDGRDRRRPGQQSQGDGHRSRRVQERRSHSAQFGQIAGAGPKPGNTMGRRRELLCASRRNGRPRRQREQGDQEQR